MTEIERVTTHTSIAHPATGELIDLDGGTDYLAAYLSEIRELEGQLRELKRALSEEVLVRMDAEATWTVHAGKYKLTGRSPDPELVYDGEALFNGLHSIARDIGLSPDAINGAVHEERVYKVSKAGVNRLRKLGGQVVKVIDRCASEKPAERRVSVGVVK